VRPDKQWKDIVAASWVYSALSSTGVAFLNWINPLFVSITSIGTQLASVSADFVTGKLKPTDALTMIGQSFGNWVNAMSYMGAEAAFALKNDAYSNRVLEMLNNANRMHQDMMKALEKIKTGTPKEKVTNAIKFLMTSTDLVRRSMASADQMWGGVLQQFIIQNEAMRQLVTKAGLTGEQAAAILNSAAQTGQKAQQDHMAKTSDRAESVLVGKDALQQSLSDAILKTLGKDAWSDVNVMSSKEAAMELGNRLSESGGPLDLINGIFEMLKLVSNSLLRKYGLNARLLTGFITVAANIINRSAYFSPVGIARALYKMNSTRAAQEKLYAQTMATDGQARMRLIEGVAGTLALLLLMMLRKDSDDEEGFVMTGEGPPEPKDKEAWLKLGHKPAHFEWVGKDGRVLFSIPYARGGFDNVALPMTFVGAMDDLQLQRKKLDKKNARAAWLYGETVVMNLTNQARFFGMKNIVNSVPTSLKEGSLAKTITYSAAPIVPWSGLMKSMSRLVTGQQDASSVNSAVMANLPLTPLVSGRPARNYLGDPVGPNATDLIGKMTERLHYAGIPIYVGVKADTRNGDIYKMLLEKGVSPSIPMRSTIESANGQITDGQWEKYLITRGNLIKDALRSDRYKIQFMEFSDAQEHIEDISRTATKATKRALNLK
jgi:polyhydroxyalkanoate synthesis regulator phasin